MYATVESADEYFAGSVFESRWDAVCGFKEQELNLSTAALDARYGKCYRESICDQEQPDLQPRCPTYEDLNGRVVEEGIIPKGIHDACCLLALYLFEESENEVNNTYDENILRDRRIKSIARDEPDIYSETIVFDNSAEIPVGDIKWVELDSLMSVFLIPGCGHDGNEGSGYAQGNVCYGL